MTEETKEEKTEKAEIELFKKLIADPEAGLRIMTGYAELLIKEKEARAQAEIMAQAAVQEAEKHRLQVEAQKPAVEFYDTVGNATDWLEMSAVAKLLAKHGYGRNSLFELLREVGVLRCNNEPYQKYVDRGYLSSRNPH